MEDNTWEEWNTSDEGTPTLDLFESRYEIAKDEWDIELRITDKLDGSKVTKHLSPANAYLLGKMLVSVAGELMESDNG